MNENFTPEMINTIFTVVVIPVLGIVAKYVISFLKSKSIELDHRINNETLSKYIYLAEDAIETAVICVNQTFVDSMKKQGNFDKTAMEKSFSLAKSKALTLMGTSAQTALKAVYEDIDLWLDNKIESYVSQNKKSHFTT